ncbi:MAG: DUF721 domain-containing protein [Bacillota bacterium]
MAESIKELLNRALRQLGISKKVKKTQLLDTWSRVIGKDIQEHTEAKYFDRGTLFVNVDNSSWAHQLLFMKQNLMEKINNKLDEELVTEIRFKVGHITKEDCDFSKEYKNETKKIELNPEEETKLQQTAESIADDNLKAKFLNLLMESKKTNKWRKNNDWKECPECSVLIPDFKSKCSICELKEGKEELVKKIEQSLYQNPWLSYNKLATNYPQLNEDDFNVIKDNLAARLEEKLDEMLVLALEDQIDKQKLRVLIQNYVMLETGVDPDNLTDRLIKKIIGSNKMKIYNNL